MSAILVTGATGTVGRQVTAELLRAGAAVRALVRDPSAARLPDGAELVTGDLSDPASLDGAAEGVSAVFLLWPFSTSEALAGLAPRAVKSLAGPGRSVVYLSAAAAGSAPATPWGRMEEVVRRGADRWTFLRPGGFAKNTLLWAPQIRAGHVVRWPYAASARPLIHEADIAAAATAVLTGGERHDGQAYHLTGPEILTHAGQVRAIGEAIGRPLRFEEVPPEEVLGDLTAALGDEAFARGALSSWERFAAEPEPATGTVRELTGTPPRTLREWAGDHAADFGA